MSLAVPSIIFAVMTNAYRTVDQYYIQEVSMEAQAAVGSSIFVGILYYAFFHLIASGASPLIARAYGAGDRETLSRLVGSALSGALVMAAVMSVLGGLGAGVMASALGLEGETARQCELYLRALSWTVLPLVLTPLVDQAFIAMGEAQLPTVLHGASLLCNLVLTPWMILDLEWGIAGAALASNGSRALTTGVGLWLLLRRVKVSAGDMRAWAQLRRVVRLGTPVTFGVASYTLVYWVMMMTSISPLGPEVNAALGIGFSVFEGVAWPCYHGLSLAVASFVGRSLGAGQPEVARQVVRRTWPVALCCGVLACGIFLWVARPVSEFFTEDPRVTAAAVTYAVILSYSQPLVAIETLCEGVLNGAGDTRSAFWASLPFNVLRVPLAWWMAFPLGWGAVGVWWAINATTLLKAVVKGVLVWREGWIDVEV